ncbi:hypothetical protein J7L65_04350, partial [Candidatus Bathyarchaeota archaeon]|nr:hypothetical protein [Candidatus Bathyarchaeota archaeon]
SVYCESTTDANGDYWGVAGAACWNITLNLRNTGTTQATIIGVFINGKAIADYGKTGDYDLIQVYDASGNQVDFSSGGTITVDPGSSTEIYIVIKQDDALTFSSGTTIELSLHSGAGNSYMKMVTLT